ncbi:hypothetical protein QQ008_02165 [Fulvivirgaceae bacterium BMA10]|uniref:Ig-like domain-containing protein n=1 Tax=Splendidivirga corallicola TaxID=3051826 RepID=A0ABT8KIP7_9BACT|nr:hypothetical protein [Fulvivirgaceae bacterium BMA10]
MKKNKTSWKLIYSLLVVVCSQSAYADDRSTFLTSWDNYSYIEKTTKKLSKTTKFSSDLPFGFTYVKKLKTENELKIRINRGRKFTNKREIEVEIRPIKISSTLIAQMKVGFKPDLSDASWEKYAASKKLTISGEDREIMVYAILKDKAGNNSSIAEDRITFDTKPPIPKNIIINNGAEYTNDQDLRVRLNLEAQDAYRMQLSNSGQFNDSDWEEFVPEKSWTLGPRDEGEKFVYARFVDRAANISEIIKTSIILDLTPPSGSVIINDNKKITGSRKVKLKITSNDAAVVRIAGPGVQNLPFSPQGGQNYIIKEWELDSIQGQKFVKVYFRDYAGNITRKAVVDDIILDTKSPEIGFFRINDGNKYTTNKEGKVTLKIGTRENPQTFKMLVSNDPDFKNAEPRSFSPRIENWQLEATEDGLKNVYLKFVDEIGNESKIRSAKVYLDREAPIVTKVIVNEDEKWVNKEYATIKIEAEGATQMELSNSPKFSEADTWEKFATVRRNWGLLKKDGKNTVYVRLRDQAGNISETSSDFILKDTKAPSGKLVINDAARFTRAQDRKVKLNFSYDRDVVEMQVGNEPNFNDISWQPVTTGNSNWILDGEDGEKRVFVRYKDEAGNLSEIIASRIVLDRQAPLYPSVIINADSLFTTAFDKIVELEISAEDADFMMVSDNSRFEGVVWEKYGSVKKIPLPGSDGEKQVFVKFKDKAGNISEVASDKIILDRYPPKPISFKINNGAEWTNDPEKKVILNIKAEGASEMIISDSPEFQNAEWQDYQNELKDYVLVGEDGNKILYISFRDDAGHRSRPLMAKINLKREF